MAINRQGPCNAFFEYVCNSALTSELNGNQVPPNIERLLPAGTSYIISIPTYQRGIAWEEEDIEEFINSQSVLLGNVILGYFPPQAGYNGYSVLIDGLQRFSVGTGILYNLWSKALSANPTNAIAGQFFQESLLPPRLQIAFPVVEHNHNALLNHRRNAISEQYLNQYNVIDAYVDRQLSNHNNLRSFVNIITSLFLNRQISIDQYVGFKDSNQLSNTFIGLNTIRVELSAIDLLRSYIISKAGACNWSDTDQDKIENDITEIFISNGKVDKLLEPFAKAALSAVEERNNLSALNLFPNWENLTITEVNRFLDFIDSFYNQSTYERNKYLYEISKCGGLPFSLVMMFYYQKFLQQNNEDVTSLIQDIQLSELHNLTKAIYRVFLESNFGRLNFILLNTIGGQYRDAASLAGAINDITTAGHLNQNPNRNWLIQTLSKVDKKKAQRVFNACLLPNINNPDSFSPLLFGRKTGMWNIDHIIPETLLINNNPGYEEGCRLQNFAPILSQYNKQMNNTPAAVKLGNNNLYEQMIQEIANNVPHPYLHRLISISQTQTLSDLNTLNDQSQLMLTTANRNIGDKRISEIADILIEVL